MSASVALTDGRPVLHPYPGQPRASRNHTQHGAQHTALPMICSLGELVVALVGLVWPTGVLKLTANASWTS
jgi:hypothetical protein